MANQSYKLSSEVEEKLFEFIRAHPVLYSGSQKPQDIEMREAIWRQIAEELQITVSDCKLRLKYIIRERLNRPKKDHNKLSTSPVAGKSSDTKYEAVKYLPDQCLEQQVTVEQVVHDDQNIVQATVGQETGIFYENELVPQLEKYQTEPLQKPDQVVIQQVQLEYLQELQPEFLKLQPCLKRAPIYSPKEIKKMKTATVQENVDHPGTSLSCPSSPSSLFFRSVASTLKNLPPPLEVEARIKIYNLVGELELRALNRPNGTLLHHVSPPNGMGSSED